MTTHAKMTFNAKQFEQAFGKFSNDVMRKHAPQAVYEAGKQLKLDADNETPKTPHKEGALKASGQTELFNGVSVITARVSYNTPYAAKWHEQEARNWTEPGSGSKYLETPLLKNTNKYYKLMADYIKESSGA